MTISKNRLNELAKKSESQIDYSDIPELNDDFWENATLASPDKTQIISLRVKQSVLDKYKKIGKGYQTRMNAVLESYAKTLK